MVKGLLGRKLGMTQVYSDNGDIIPVTVIQAGPCYVVQIKTGENDGYDAVQLGFLDKKKKRTTRPEINHAKKAGLGPKRFVREVACNNTQLKLGQEITVEIFNGVKKVDVIGTNKGKGFAGVMKRWGFKGGPATHGSTRHRRPGSISPGTDPGRVMKGRRMGGRMGGERVTVKNLDIIKIDNSKNLMLIKGAVPGPNGGYVIIHTSKIE